MSTKYKGTTFVAYNGVEVIEAHSIRQLSLAYPIDEYSMREYWFYWIDSTGISKQIEDPRLHVSDFWN